jgi:hypothetical protein
MADISKTTTLDALVKAVMPLATKVQKGYTSNAGKVFEGGDMTDPTNEVAQEAAYHSGVVLGTNTAEAAAALGFVGPRPYRKAQNAWADKRGLNRRITRRTKEQIEADKAKEAPKAEAKADTPKDEAAPKAPAKRTAKATAAA